MAKFSGRWWPFHPLNDDNVKRQGRRDGVASPPIPQWHATSHPPFVRDVLVQAANHDIHAQLQRWARRDHRRKWRLVHAEKSIVEARARIAEAELRRKEGQDRYHAIHGLFAPEVSGARGLVYLFWMAMLFLFELPLNTVVFRVFRESEALTVLFTIGVSIVLLLSAHELGRLLRRDSEEDPAGRFFVPLLILFPLMIIIGVAYAREAYLSSLPASVDLLNPWMLYGAFAAINLAIFAVATVLSHRHHEAGIAELAQASSAWGRARRHLWRAEQRATRIRTKRQKAYQGMCAACARIHDETQRLYGLYQTQNLRTRSDREGVDVEMPDPFRMKLELIDPPPLDDDTEGGSTDQAA